MPGNPERQDLVLDTNQLLHYLDIRQIDWLKFTGARTVILHVPMEVVRELDRRKQDPRLRDRARKAISVIEAIIEAQRVVRKGVELTIDPELASSDIPDGLRSGVEDDRILAQAIRYARANPQAEVALVSGDLTLKLKSHDARIQHIKPDPAWELPPLKDETAKKLQKAMARIEKLENRLPELKVMLAQPDGAEPSNRFTFSLGEPVSALDMSDIMREASMRPTEGPPEFARLRTLREQISKVQVRQMSVITPGDQRFIRKAQAFMEGYPEYVHALNRYRRLSANSFAVKPIVANGGRGPADDIGVHLYLPAGIVVADADEGLERPEEPEPPFPDLGTLWGPRQVADLFRASHPLAPQPEPNVSGPVVSYGAEGAMVTYSVKRLIHGYRCPLGDLVIAFEDRESVSSFSIRYDCTTASHPGCFSGELHLIHDK